jgi:signal transduction histidine kinase
MSVNTMHDDGEPAGYVLVAHDITAEREATVAIEQALVRERTAADRLRELDQVKSDFVASVSHDLRTPLTSIVGNTELLLDGDAGELGPMQRRLLATVDRNARRLDSLVGDLLMLSRIESGTLRMRPRDVPVGDIIDGALEALAVHRNADVSLDVEVPAEPVLVHGDPEQLERVTTNLVSNAFKFTPPGGRVGISLDADPERIRLEVSDTGIGIPEEELPYVFDRFFRSTRAANLERPGTGLGLTIAKSIVEQHGGSIRAGANRAGGTTMTVILPRLPTSADTSAREPA